MNRGLTPIRDSKPPLHLFQVIERLAEVLEQRLQNFRPGGPGARNTILEQRCNASAVCQERMSFTKPGDHAPLDLLHRHIAQTRAAGAAPRMLFGDERPAAEELCRLDRELNTIHGTP
jgi:hypothetical protein